MGEEGRRAEVGAGGKGKIASGLKERGLRVRVEAKGLCGKVYVVWQLGKNNIDDTFWRKK